MSHFKAECRAATNDGNQIYILLKNVRTWNDIPIAQILPIPYFPFFKDCKVNDKIRFQATLIDSPNGLQFIDISNFQHMNNENSTPEKSNPENSNNFHQQNQVRINPANSN